jgi:5-methylcytosine-specific restriction endonuclease McrA
MTTRSKLSRKEKDRVLERGGWMCAICTAVDQLEIDHIIALCLGGTNQVSNLQVLCHECHREKTRTDLAEFYRRQREEAIDAYVAMMMERIPRRTA